MYEGSRAHSRASGQGLELMVVLLHCCASRLARFGAWGLGLAFLSRPLRRDKTRKVTHLLTETWRHKTQKQLKDKMLV